MGVEMMAPMHRVDGNGIHHPCLTLKDYPEDAYSHYDLIQFGDVVGVPTMNIFTNVSLDNAEFADDTCHNYNLCPLTESQ